MSHLYRCAVCGYESHEHTTCPHCMGGALAGMSAGVARKAAKPAVAQSAMLGELAAAVHASPKLAAKPQE
jgi:hypothetical protein